MLLQVIDRLAEQRINYTKIIACGGLAENPYYRTALACATQLPVLAPRAGNLMCVGAAMCAQAAAEGMSLEEVVEMGAGDTVGVFLLYVLINYFYSSF